MKLVYIATIRFPTERAHGLAIAKMCEAFGKKGVNVELLVPKRTQSFNLKNADWEKFYNIKKDFKVKRLWCIDLLGIRWYASSWLQSVGFLILTFSFYVSLFFYFLKNKTEIVYTREVLAIPLLLFFKKKIFIELHNWPTGKLGSRFYKVFLNKASGIICISKLLANEVKKLGINQRKILLAPSGVGQEFFKKINKKTARGKLKLSFNKKIIVYTGSLTEEKGRKTLLKAVKDLSDKREILFLIIGSTFAAGGDERLQKEIKKLDNACFLGYQHYNKIPLFLAAADILVLPNSAKVKQKAFKEYTSPMKLYEYMASGRPVIASKIPAIASLVVDKREVLFFKPDDAQDLARKILILLKNKKLATLLARKSRNFALKYTWDNRAERILKFMNINAILPKY